MSGRQRRTVWQRGVLAALAPCGLFALSACSYNLFQTARTEPAGKVTAATGMSYVSNKVLDQNRSGNPFIAVGFQGGARVGVTPHLDLGLGGFQFEGAVLDAKYDLFDHADALALAPRVGVAYGFNHDVFMAEVGGIVSYRVAPAFEPYLAVTFANHWIGHYADPPPPQPGWHYAARTGSGDGLLQLNVGIEMPVASHLALLVEYAHWFALQDDPGDYYSFVPTNVLGAGVRF